MAGTLLTYNEIHTRGLAAARRAARKQGYDVDVRYTESPEAARVDRYDSLLELVVPWPDNTMNLSIALHEVGHVVCGHMEDEMLAKRDMAASYARYEKHPENNFLISTEVEASLYAIRFLKRYNVGTTRALGQLRDCLMTYGVEWDDAKHLLKAAH